MYGLSTVGNGENKIDLEPDQYFLNFLNFSGKFVFDQRTKKPIIQKFSDFKIEPIYEWGYDIKGWIVTDKDGIQYYFGTSKDGLRTAIDKAQSISNYSYLPQAGLQVPEDGWPNNNAWQLMDIVTPSKKHMKFEYALDEPVYFVKNYDEGPASKISSYFSKISMNQYHIKAIYFDKGKVLFTKSSTVREDLAYSYALEKIEIFGNDNVLKTKHLFNYTYTTSEDTNSYYVLRDGDPQAKKRMFLKSIITKGKDTKSKEKKHSFVYDSTILPNRFSTAQDNWGYYNAKDNGSFSSFFEGDNRTVDTIKSQAGMLKKIIYPTGGSANFEYEHNLVIPPSFYENLLTNPTNPIVDGKCLITKLPSLFQDGVYRKPFTIGLIKPLETIKVNSNVRFFDNAASCSSTANTMDCPFIVTVYKTNPMTIMGNLYIGSNGHILLGSGDYILEVNPRTPEGEDPNNMMQGTFTVSLSWKETAPTTADPGLPELLYGPGKRIKRIVWDDNLGGKTSKTYKYLHNSGKSSGKTFSLPNMYYVSREYNGIPVLDAYGATAGSPLTNFQGNSIGYSFVTEYNGENNNNNIGKTEYTFTIPDDTGDFYKFPYHSPTDNEWLRGTPLNIKYYTNNQGNYSIVKEIKNTYRYGDMANTPTYFTSMLDPNSENGYENHKRKFSLPLIIFIKDPNLSGSAAFNNPNSYKIFYATGGTVDLSNTEETEFMTGSPNFGKTTKYFYNYDFGNQLKKVQTNSSTAETLETKYFYPQDPEMASEPFVNKLIAKNRIGNPLVTQSLKNGLKLSEQKTVFDNSATTSGLLLPKFIYANKGTTALNPVTDKKITFDQYDDNGNIIQYSVENGTPVCIIWGYAKTQPIAKIENITYANIPAGLIIAAQNTSNTGTESALLGALDNLRTALPTAMVTTYTYIPLIGVSTITDPKNDKTSYTYDGLGRLQFVKDAQGNLLSENQYRYKNQ